MGNSLPDVKQAMLKEIGAASVAALFEQIPQDHRLKKPLKLPEGMRSEAQLRRHLTDMLAQNESAATHLTFLGAGCWPHHVPAVVDEIVGTAFEDVERVDLEPALGPIPRGIPEPGPRHRLTLPLPSRPRAEATRDGGWRRRTEPR